MKNNVFFLVSVFIGLTLVLGVAVSCGDDDDDDDDDAAADDTADDDTTDDDTAGGFPCEDQYDVIIDGATDLAAFGTSEWTAKLVIADDGVITGTLFPDETDLDSYDVTGARNDETTGYLDGSFATPENMQAACAEALVYNHIDFTITDGAMSGTVTFYCGEVSADTLIGTFDASGTVTCGDFAA